MEMQTDSQPFRAVVQLSSPDDTARLGTALAAGLGKGDAVALTGDLGAGKTALARDTLRALGVTGPIPSPTFTLVLVYETARLTVRHYDLYRVEDESELEELGLDEALSEGAALIEWPERAPGAIPGDALHITLTITGNDARQAVLEGPASWAGIFSGFSRD